MKELCDCVIAQMTNLSQTAEKKPGGGKQLMIASLLVLPASPQVLLSFVKENKRVNRFAVILKGFFDSAVDMSKR